MAGKNGKKWMWAVFILYAGVMLVLLFGRDRSDTAGDYWTQVSQSVNLIPFQTILLYLRLLSWTDSGYLIRHAVVNLGGNVILFIPLGLFLPSLLPKLRKVWRCLLAGTGIITTVELLQMLTLLGSCDVDDLILNLVGVAMGYGVFRLLNWEEKT